MKKKLITTIFSALLALALFCAAQAAVDEGQLAGGEDQLAGAHRRDVGGDRCGDLGQSDAQLRQSGVPAGGLRTGHDLVSRRGA